MEKYSFLENECLLAATEISVYCDTHSQEFGIINKAEIDVSLELSCFFDDPADVGNLISGSFAFSFLFFKILFYF